MLIFGTIGSKRNNELMLKLLCFQVIKCLNRLKEIGIYDKMTDIRKKFPRLVVCRVTINFLRSDLLIVTSSSQIVTSLYQHLD